jgi:FkbM family methyltransferase
MTLPSTTLPDGRSIRCVNTYEVDFSLHEIFSEDLERHGLDLPRDGTYLDVGANIGLFALYLRDRCPAGRILAYEPMPAAYEALAANAAALSPPAEAFRLALGQSPGTLAFDYYPGLSALSTANRAVGERLSEGLKQLLGGAGSQAVREIVERTAGADKVAGEGFLDRLFQAEPVVARVDTVSNQLAALSVEAVDLLKIDTEGSEREVLAGIAEGDWPRIRQLLVEVHLGVAATDGIEQELRDRGYETARGSHPLSQGGAAVYHLYATRGRAAMRP